MVEGGREVWFRDPRPPHAIQVELERKLTVLFHLEADEKLVMWAGIRAGGCPCRVTLTLESARPDGNCYSFRVEPKAAGLSEGWMKFWTDGFTPGPPPLPDDNVPQRYAALVRRTMEAEAHLTTVEDVQRAIVAGMREGMRFSTSHKEGGTVITLRGGKFVAADYGESNESRSFNNEAAFFAYLRQFYDWTVSSHVYPEKAPELYAWRMILRLMRK